MRKRNTKVFAEILDSMPNLSYCTTWSEAQQMLLDNPRFTDDPDLHSKYANFIGTIDNGIRVRGLWCLTPLSTIFQLYRGNQFV